MEYYPNYYPSFRCIADKCFHSCCRGWEIDVDEASLKRYGDHPDIIRYIKDGCFILDDKENCPFLREDGLCRMILRYGEDMLCDICKDHPRFRNYRGDDVYTGLGLCCEAAASLILDQEEPFALVPGKKLGEVFKLIEEKRDDILSVIDRFSPVTLSPSERAELFLSLERLDPEWDKMLLKITDDNGETSCDAVTSRRLSNFASYILFRHGEDKIRFAGECTLLIYDLYRAGYEIAEAARMFSCEVEYSDINPRILLNRFEE
ncbi:MAG: flagellin lysine-N-methylase [Clostridiales bacterium]|nr:flagellin lysine-N-methylase [Clostridiales bacterium]